MTEGSASASKSSGVAHGASTSPVIHTARSDGVVGEEEARAGGVGEAGHARFEHVLHVVSEHRRAVSSVSMSPMRRTLRISAGRYVVASGITSAPMRLAASHATTQSCPYGKYRPTRVPLPMPAASMRRARRRDSSSACA